MDVSKEQAEGSLEQIQAVTRQTRRKVAAGSAGPLLILWGAIWFVASLVGYLSYLFEFKVYRVQLTQRLSVSINAAGLCWILLVTIGTVVSWIIGTGKSPTKSPENRRWLLCWLTLYVYGIIWVAIFQPRSDYQTVAFFATLAMFMYVVMGIWADRWLFWLGVVVTLLIVSGFFLLYLQPTFWLWLAVLGGGTLAGTGLYIRKAWR